MEYKDALQIAGQAGNVHKAYWYATVAAIAHPSTRKLGMKMFSYGARATYAAGKGAASGFVKTPFVRGGQMSLARLPGAAARGAMNPYVLAGLLAYELTDIHLQTVSTDRAYAKAFAGGTRGLFL